MKLVSAALLISSFFLAFSASAQQVRPQHQMFAKDCAICHTQENAVGGNAFVTPSDKACLTCHQSYEALADKTKNLNNGEPNPHASHHYGKGIACTACHGEHTQGKVYCNNCHDFKYSNK